MFKRIMSTIMAVVIAAMTLPLVSINVSAEEYTTEELNKAHMAFYTAVYKYTMCNGTYEDKLYKGAPYGGDAGDYSDYWVTIIPSSLNDAKRDDWKGKDQAKFEQVALNLDYDYLFTNNEHDYSTRISFTNYLADQSVKSDTIASQSESGFVTNTVSAQAKYKTNIAGYNESNLQMDEGTTPYGSLGVIRGSSNPTYRVLYVTGDFNYNGDGERYHLASDSDDPRHNVGFYDLCDTVHTGNKYTTKDKLVSGQWSNKYSAVDPTAILLTVSRLHLWYHDPNFWDKVVGHKDYFDVVSYFYTKYTGFSKMPETSYGELSTTLACNDKCCPFLKTATVTGNAGAKGDITVSSLDNTVLPFTGLRVEQIDGSETWEYDKNIASVFKTAYGRNLEKENLVFSPTSSTDGVGQLHHDLSSIGMPDKMKKLFENADDVSWYFGLRFSKYSKNDWVSATQARGKYDNEIIKKMYRCVYNTMARNGYDDAMAELCNSKDSLPSDYTRLLSTHRWCAAEHAGYLLSGGTNPAECEITDSSQAVFVVEHALYDSIDPINSIFEAKTAAAKEAAETTMVNTSKQYQQVKVALGVYSNHPGYIYYLPYALTVAYDVESSSSAAKDYKKRLDKYTTEHKTYIPLGGGDPVDYNYKGFETYVNLHRDEIVTAISKAVASRGNTDILKDIFGVQTSSSGGTAPEVAKDYTEYLLYALNVCADSAKDEVALWIERALQKHITYVPDNPLKYKDTSKTLTEPATIVVKSGLDQLLKEYETLSTLSVSENWKPLLTIRIRAEIINYCAQYGLSADALGEYKDEILTDNIDRIKSWTPDEYKDTLDDAIEVDIYTSPVKYKGSQFWFRYQTYLLKECFYLSKTIYIDLMVFYLNAGAVKLETYSQSLEGIQNIKWVLDTLDSSLTSQVWTDNIGTYEGDPGKSLSVLYAYLVECGQLSSDEYYSDIFTESNPITTFWSVTNNNITFSKDLMTGRAMSATYVPMQTNLYDPYNLFDYVDMEWIEGFHSKYGFHRKALYIDTNVDAAVDSYVSGNVGKTRVATLEDLLQPDKDIVLYLDDNYYNITGIAEKLGKATDRVSSEELERNWFQSFQDMVGWADETEPERMLKSAEYKTYSYKIAENTSGMDYVPTVLSEDGEVVDNENKKAYDDYLLTATDIKTYLVDATSYSDMMAYALVSNIYRDKETYNVVARTIANNEPVFVSSPTLATLSGTQNEQFDTIYNYALLKNIQGNMMVGYDTSIDVTSPIYIDVYGNIVTESGICVIPAACNATLHESSVGFTPISVGFLSTYGSSWKIPTSYNLDEAKMNAFFVKNEEEGVWDIRAKTILGVSMNFAALSYSDPNVKVALKEWYEYDLNAGLLDDDITLAIVHEVIRGAPIEYIDMDYEGLNLARKVDKTGILAASKLDGIIKSLDWDDDGSIMSVPTMSFIDNYQYIIVFVFKILLVIIVTALMITVYIDAVRQRISGRTVLKCISTLVVGVGSVLLLPTAFDLSYYQSNKLLLQDEAEYIMLLNTEKNMSGQEVGVYEVTEPEQHTQVLLRLENYSFDWMSHLNEVVFGNSVQVLDEAYDEFLKESFISDAENVQIMNDGVYMDIQDIFNTSVLNFSTSTKHLYQKVSVDPVTSFYLPYYYFLDAILTNMNDYNSSNNIYAYSTKIMRGGNVKTVNLCDAYFNSEDFMDGSTDVLGLYQLYSVETSLWYEPIYSTESISQAQQSQWYIMDDEAFTTQELVDRVNLVVEHARKYVNDNRDMIGRITDETFIKCMAMSCAVYYNNLFGIPSANSYEIYKLSNADLMRLTVCDKATTLEDSPMSFARFVYNEAGTPGVYASVFLVIVTMFTAIAKTVITLAVFILLLVSLYVFKILLQKGGDSVAGYLLTLLVICATNVLYAVILKISLAIPQTGLAPTICILLQILVQLAYLFILTLVLIFAIRDWRNIGATFYREAGSKLSYKFRKLAGKVTNRRFTTPVEDADAQVMGTTDTDKLEKLRRRQARRQRKVGES